MARFQFIDWVLIGSYFILLIVLSLRKKNADQSETSFLLSGRTLTLPAFVATLVSTWYGGILGVGEFTYYSGISQWFLFGLPYYVFAILFAVFLAGKIREGHALTIPEAIRSVYGSKAADVSSVWVFLLVSPAPYLLMLGLLLQFVLGGNFPILWYSIAVGIFSAAYVSYSGFKAVVRTDMLQLVLMYAGFALLLGYSVANFGGFSELWQTLPESHQKPWGGHSVQFVLVWFFIAMWTFVDPGFHQRASAAQNAATARKGIFVSVGFWFVFDMLTLMVGLYGFTQLPNISNPALVYPELAHLLLPAGLQGLFFLGLLATIMSTLDSFLLISGQTLGRDMLSSRFPKTHPVLLTRYAIFLSVGIAIVLTIVFPSVISLWYVIGSVLIPGLLIPVLGSYLPTFRLPGHYGLVALVLPVVTSLSWLLLGLSGSESVFDYAFLGIEPFYPGLGIALIIFVLGKQKIIGP